MTYLDKWYLADDGSAGRYDSGDADTDLAGDVEDMDVCMYDKHDAQLVAKSFQTITSGVVT